MCIELGGHILCIVLRNFSLKHGFLGSSFGIDPADTSKWWVCVDTAKDESASTGAERIRAQGMFDVRESDILCRAVDTS